MSIPVTPGWNDPPSLLANSSSNDTQSKRLRSRVYHSIDGVGAAGGLKSCLTASTYGLSSPMPPIHTQPTVFLPEQPILPSQPSSQLPTAYSVVNNGNTVAPSPFTDSASTLSQLTSQINRIILNTLHEIPGKSAIMASLSSLQNDLSMNRLSANMQGLVQEFISYLEQLNFKAAEETLDAINKSEKSAWIGGLQHLLYYAYLQTART